MSEILVNTIKKADGTGSLTVPADTGTVLTTATTASSIPGYGNVTMADLWRVPANISLTDQVNKDIDNLERADDSTAGFIGSAMSESSGIFTFPETGIYLISANTSFTRSSAGTRAILLSAAVSTDSGSTFDDVSRARSGMTDSSNSSANNGQNTLYALVDVTDTSTFRIKFYAYAIGSSIQVVGNTDRNETTFLFIRLGDT